jgi:hypothetical protein
MIDRTEGEKERDKMRKEGLRWEFTNLREC